jgi:hypothetical protein
MNMEAGLSCCEFVAALVVKVPRMPLDPLSSYDVLFGELVKFFPEIRVGKRIGFRLSPPGPSVHTPLVTPRCDAFQKVSAISEQQYLTGLQECLEALDGSPKLHPIVCRVRSATSALHGVSSVAQNVSPTTRARIANASSVGDESDLLHAYILLLLQ